MSDETILPPSSRTPQPPRPAPEQADGTVVMDGRTSPPAPADAGDTILPAARKPAPPPPAAGGTVNLAGAPVARPDQGDTILPPARTGGFSPLSAPDLDLTGLGGAPRDTTEAIRPAAPTAPRNETVSDETILPGRAAPPPPPGGNFAETILPGRGAPLPGLRTDTTEAIRGGAPAAPRADHTEAIRPGAPRRDDQTEMGTGARPRPASDATAHDLNPAAPPSRGFGGTGSQTDWAADGGSSSGTAVGADPFYPSASGGHTAAVEKPKPKPAPAGGGATIPGFEILGVLGKGGMGVVYKAKQAELGRLVALKMILSGTQANDEELLRFKMEGETLGKLEHPNIVKVWASGVFQERPYFALEFIDGGDLDRKLKATKGAGLPPAEAALMVEKVARAMYTAHSRGLLHRDLKPANIMLTREGEPKITDFGLVRDLYKKDEGLTTDGSIMGTPSYMSPEQAKGRIKELTPATDIYALGAILYDLLVGRPPFKGETVMDTLQEVITREPTPPTQVRAGLPRDLEVIILKCLDKDPAKRYGTAELLADDLKRWREGDPILARPVGRVEWAVKWARKNKAMAGLIAAAVLLLVTLAAGGMVVAKQQSDLAEANAETARVEAAKAEAERQATEKERALKDEARASLAKAQEAADKFLAQVGGMTARTFEAKRPRLYQEAKGLYEEFLKSTHADNQATRQRIAQSWKQVGTVNEKLGQDQAAEQAYKEAQKAFQDLIRDYPKDGEGQRGLGEVYNNLGILLTKMNRLQEAEQAYTQAVALKEAMVTANRDSDLARLELARGYLNRGNFAFTVRKAAPAAEADYRKALETLQPVAPTSSLAREARRLRATALDLQAAAAMLQPPFPGGVEKTLEAGHGLWKGLFTESNGDPDDGLNLARNRLNTGYYWQNVQSPDHVKKAARAYQEAIDTCAPLAADDPGNADFRQIPADAYKNLALMYEAEKRYPDMEKAAGEAVELYRGLAKGFPKREEFRTFLAWCLDLRAKALAFSLRLESSDADARWEEAIAIQQQLAKAHPKEYVPWEALFKFHENRAAAWARADNLKKFAQAAEAMQGDLEEGAKLFPGQQSIHDILFTLRDTMAKALMRGKEYEKAKPWMAKVIAQLEASVRAQPAQVPLASLLTTYRASQIEALIQTRAYAEAHKGLKTLVAEAPAGWPVEGRVELAASVAAGIEASGIDDKLTPKGREQWAKTFGDEAMALLQDAVQRGFKNATLLEKVEEFKPLRNRQDYKDLLAKLKGSAPPAPPAKNNGAEKKG